MANTHAQDNPNPLADLQRLLHNDLIDGWWHSCQAPPDRIDEQFYLEINMLLDEAARNLSIITLNNIGNYEANANRAKWYGHKLQMILHHVENGENVKFCSSLVKDAFLHFEKYILDHLNLNIFFSTSNIKKTSKQDKIFNVIYQTIQLVPLEKQKEVARQELSFLSLVKHGPIMSEIDFERLLNLVDQMLITQSIPKNIEPFPHLHQKVVPVVKIRQAFANINYKCFSGKQLWIIDSFLAMFNWKYRESTISHWRQPYDKQLKTGK